MKVLQSGSFQRKIKKFTKKQKLELDEPVKLIAEDPRIGEEKKGDLRGVYVHKFKIKADLYLLAYRIVDGNLELITIGSHENYYRDLKKYMKSS
jgi:mRNA-degrading endonuclease YafQ of YafQ-DinJ toxin-antitoxin module